MNNKPHSFNFIENQPKLQREEYFKDLPKIVKGASINLFGSVFGKALYVFYTIFLAHIFGAHDLGLYFLGLSVIFFLGVIGNMGLNSAAIRYTALYHARKDLQRLKGITIIASILSFLIGIILTITVFIFGDVVSIHIFHKPGLGIILKILSLSLPFECLMRILLGSTQGLKFMTYTAFVESILWIGIRFIFTLILMAGFKMQLDAALWAYVISSSVSAGIALYFASQHIPIFDTSISTIVEYKDIMRFSIPTVFSEMVYNLIAQSDVLILGFFVTAMDIGIYAVAIRILTMAQVIFTIFMPVFNPFISELYDKKQFDHLANLLKVITRLNVMISFPIFISIICFPATFLHVFGEGFLKASSCLVILSIARIFTAPSILPNSMITMIGRPELQLVNNVVMLVLVVILNLILTSAYGIVGAATATGFCLLVISVVRIIEVYKLIGIHPFTYGLVKPVIAAIVAYMVSYGIQLTLGFERYSINVFIIFIFCIIYGIILWAMKFSEDELFIKTTIINKLADVKRAFH
jgi:O-antigen/teichoic acid export membrane protein